MSTEATGAAIYEAESLLTPEDLAQRLKVPVSWVYEQTRVRTVVRSENAIPVVPVGRYLRFYWPDICDWLKRQAQDRGSRMASSGHTKRITKNA